MTGQDTSDSWKTESKTTRSREALRKFKHKVTGEEFFLMLCFRDMTFCSASLDDCSNTTCKRHFGEDDKKAAAEWWGTPDAPVAFSCLKPGCKDYRPCETSSTADPTPT